MEPEGTNFLERRQVDDIFGSVDQKIKRAVYPVSRNAKTIINKAIKVSGTSMGTFSFSTSMAIGIQSRLVWGNPFKGQKIFAIPYSSIYQGTVVSMANQLYPLVGTNVTHGRYQVQSDFDYQNWGGTESERQTVIYDTNGTSSQILTIVSKWFYLDNANLNA